MRVLGEICLLVSLVSTGYAGFLCVMPGSNERRLRQRIAIAASVIGLVALTTSIVVLALALLWRDFRFEYVAQYASRLLPWQYCLSALWVGQAGSLLLWAWMMAVMAVLLHITAGVSGDVPRTAFGLVMGDVCFLVAVMVFAADPMAPNLTPADEGAGLSPLLQHPSMLIHPPIVFLSYAAWTVPCALALGALCYDPLHTTWIQLARPWAVSAWILLGVGLLLGAHWAYQELGWGGYWGWDPVENGSLLPWLTGTAFIHSLLAWRHRGCLKKTAFALAIVTYGLCNFATFLTRSGIFSSVHAFSESPIGWMFLLLMFALVASGVWLLIRHRAALSGPRLSSSLFARENLIIASIFLLLLLTTVVMVGTLVAPLSKMFVGRMIQVGPEFYNKVLLPIGLVLLAMTAAVPLLQWGAPPRTKERRLLVISLAVSLAFAAAAFAMGARHPLVVTVVALAALTATTVIAVCFHDRNQRGMQFGWQGFVSVVRSGRRRYAAYTIHFGIACVAIGIAGSSVGTDRKEVELSEGDVIHWADRQIHYLRLDQSQLPDKLVAEAVLEVARHGENPVTLRPARHLHILQNEWTTEVAIDSSWAGDFYTVLHAGLGDGRVSMTLVHNPMIRWIWVGGILVTVSAVVGVMPSPSRRRVLAGATTETSASDDDRRIATAA
jgi:cytochrome c-type biogenesis protein CcmF